MELCGFYKSKNRRLWLKGNQNPRFPVARRSWLPQVHHHQLLRMGLSHPFTRFIARLFMQKKEKKSRGVIP
jgi:hypothetical protein